MGMLILTGIIAVVVFVCCIKHFKQDMGSWFGLEEVLLSILITVLVSVLSCMLIFISSFFFHSEHVETPSETVEIATLKDNSNIGGSFFLGSGTINETQKYYYMVDTHKGKQMRSVDADEYVYVKEGNVDQPKLETYNGKFTSKFAIFMFGEKTGYSEYIFHIPEGSVTTEFNVDME